MMRPEEREAAWERFVQTCTAEHVEQFLAEVCDPDWLLHVNYFNLDAELDFIERNDLNSMLVASKFAYPLWSLESSGPYPEIPLVESYKALFDDYSGRYFSYEAPEKLVHLMSRQVVRNRLALPQLTQGQIDAFYAQPQHCALLPPLSPHSHSRSANEISHAELLWVCDFLKVHYSDVVAYWVTLLTKAELQGYVGSRSLGGHSTALGIVGSTVAYFLSDKISENFDLRAAVLDILTEQKITKSPWLRKW